MKKVFSFVIVLLLFNACLAQKQKLELNLTKGKTYTQKTLTIVSSMQTINGTMMNSDVSMTAKINYKVIDVRDTVYDMEVSYESYTMKSDFVEQSGAVASNTHDMLSTLLDGMKHKPFLVTMNRKGYCQIKNMDDLLATMFEKHQCTEEQKKQMISQVNEVYGEKMFTGIFQASTAIFPNLPIAKGEKWTIKKHLEGILAVNTETVYQLKEITDSYYLISVNATIENDKESLKTNQIPEQCSQKGTMTSEIKLDKKTAWIIEAKSIQITKGNNLLMVYKPDATEDEKGIMTIKTETTVTDK